MTTRGADAVVLFLFVIKIGSPSDVHKDLPKAALVLPGCS